MLGTSNLNIKKYSVNTATGKLTSLILNDEVEMIKQPEDITITENGEYTDGPYGTVTVNVSGSGSTLYCWRHTSGEDSHNHLYTTTLQSGRVDVIYGEEDSSQIDGNIIVIPKTRAACYYIDTRAGDLYLGNMGKLPPGAEPIYYERYTDGDIIL